MKKFLGILILLFGFTCSAQSTLNCPNYSGEWIGSCRLGEDTYESETEIIQKSCTDIQINGKKYFIGKPTIVVKTGSDKSEQKYKEVNSYNLRWSPEKIQILISIRWLGWNLNQAKTWSGAGAGTLKRIKNKLRSIRNFRSGKEVCHYELL